MKGRKDRVARDKNKAHNTSDDPCAVQTTGSKGREEKEHGRKSTAMMDLLRGLALCSSNFPLVFSRSVVAEHAGGLKSRLQDDGADDRLLVVFSRLGRIALKPLPMR